MKRKVRGGGDPDLIPVPILACQTKPPPLRTEHHELFIGILQQAFSDAQENPPAEGRSNSEKAKEQILIDRESARWWFAVESDPDWPGSFENICQMLDLDPRWIRRMLVKKGWAFGRTWRSLFSGINAQGATNKRKVAA